MLRPSTAVAQRIVKPPTTELLSAGQVAAALALVVVEAPEDVVLEPFEPLPDVEVLLVELVLLDELPDETPEELLPGEALDEAEEADELDPDMLDELVPDILDELLDELDEDELLSLNVLEDACELLELMLMDEVVVEPVSSSPEATSASLATPPRSTGTQVLSGPFGQPAYRTPSHSKKLASPLSVVFQCSTPSTI